MSKPALVALPYSPWSRKARWALDHHGIAYRLPTYLPMVGTPWLRLRTRRLTGKLTVPVWLEPGRVLTDSFDIARHAEAVGSGAPLFPPEALDAIARWNATSERCLAAGRALTTAAVAGDAVALRESVPKAMRLGPLAGAVGKLGVRYLERKYGFGPEESARHEATLREDLDALRAALGGREHLIGDRLTYADVVMVVVFDFVAPPPDLPIGPRSRELWHKAGLIADHGDLLAWRDRRLLERPKRVR